VTLDVLIGQYERLRRELLEARAMPVRHLSRVERVAEELLATQRAIAELHSFDEQTHDPLPPFSITR